MRTLSFFGVIFGMSIVVVTVLTLVTTALANDIQQHDTIAVVISDGILNAEVVPSSANGSNEATIYRNRLLNIAWFRNQFSQNIDSNVPGKSPGRQPLPSLPSQPQPEPLPLSPSHAQPAPLSAY
jgi:hypothetical protein